MPMQPWDNLVIEIVIPFDLVPDGFEDELSDFVFDRTQNAVVSAKKEVVGL